MFSAFNFAWPVELKSTLNTVSASNFNLQILAPECSVTFDYKVKWLVVQSIPLSLLLALAVLFLGNRGFTIWQRRRATAVVSGAAQSTAKAKISSDAIVGMFFTLMCT